MKKILLIVIMFGLFILNTNAEEKVIAKFLSCVDGDTFKVELDGEKYSVRLLAVDTPETVKVGTEVEPYGKEASDYTCDKITNGKKIELEFDPGSDRKDKYDRLLAWVYVDESMLQKELISLGYAKVAYIYGEYKYTDQLYELEEKAASEEKGIWSEEEYVSTKEEKTFLEELEDLIKESIKKWFKKLINDIKKEINKAFESIFD